jgi:hypothetical protein
MHLRVIAPVELRDAVIDLLSGNPGVTHLVVHHDAVGNSRRLTPFQLLNSDPSALPAA